MERNLRHYATFFAAAGVLGVLGLVALFFSALGDYRAAEGAWIYLVAAVAVGIQAGWFYCVSEGLAILLERSNRPP